MYYHVLYSRLHCMLFHVCLLSFCVVFSPANNQWSVGNVMNSKDMKKKDQYCKLLYDHLSEGRRQYQVMEERVVPEESSVTGGDEQIMKLKQQLEEVGNNIAIYT